MEVKNAIPVAINEAKKVQLYRFRHGCVIFTDKKIISRGHNRRKTVSILKKYGYERCWLHAESDAIIRALISKQTDLKNATLLVIRDGKTKICNSKPCLCCVSLISDVGIKQVIYSNTEGQLVELMK